MKQQAPAPPSNPGMCRRRNERLRAEQVLGVNAQASR
jgi:hypothetical protein